MHIESNGLSPLLYLRVHAKVRVGGSVRVCESTACEEESARLVFFLECVRRVAF
jgi:hypothetical protein